MVVGYARIFRKIDFFQKLVLSFFPQEGLSSAIEFSGLNSGKELWGA